MYNAYKIFGSVNTAKYALSLFSNQPVTVIINGIQYPLKIRPWTSDIFAFEQVFSNKEYDFHISIKLLIA